MTAMNSNHSTVRLYFLDWVRILAFFVLILYHVGMYYVSWDWHVKSPHASDAIEPLMMLSSPWRLGLLFLISGVASRFMVDRIATSRFLRQRSLRLLVPLLFGMFVIVPPQPYLEVVEKVAYLGSYAEFMQLYVSAYGGFCRGTDCLDMPTWNHLWFVANLWIYTVVFGTLVALLGTRFETLSQRLATLLTGWKIIALPVAVLGLARLALLSPTTHGLVDDWYIHANYFTLFLIGALLARQHVFWQRLDAVRWTSLGIALACWATLIVYFSLPEDLLKSSAIGPWRDAQHVVYALCSWTAMTAVCGFAHRHLQFDSAKRRYLTEAVFPVYILHQTLIVTLAHAMKPARLAPAIEGPVLIVLTICISFGVFEIVRRFRPLRPLFGLGPVASKEQPESSSAAQVPAA